MILLPASEFTIEELTSAYNQTRTDYLIPMPMNPARLHEYILLFDVDLDASVVAVIDQTIVGLGMLGVRSETGWITRLGVLPQGRRKGTGSGILQALLDQAKSKDISSVWLEVIHGNEPAHELFRKFGFRETRELIVARRPPGTINTMMAVKSAHKVRYLQHDEVLELHCHRQEHMNWLNGVETMRNVGLLTSPYFDPASVLGRQELPQLAGIYVEFLHGASGWVSYQASTLQLKRICVEVVRGEPTRTTAKLLELLHRLHTSQDAVIENIPDDECWLGYKQAGYFEVFRRIEMVREPAAPDNS